MKYIYATHPQNKKLVYRFLMDDKGTLSESMVWSYKAHSFVSGVDYCGWILDYLKQPDQLLTEVAAMELIEQLSAEAELPSVFYDEDPQKEYTYAYDVESSSTVFRGEYNEDGRVINCSRWDYREHRFRPYDDAWGWLRGLEDDSRLIHKAEEALEHIVRGKQSSTVNNIYDIQRPLAETIKDYKEYYKPLKIGNGYFWEPIPCPVCGKYKFILSLDLESKECPVCHWKFCVNQLENPVCNGRNKMTVNQARIAYAKGEPIE